MLIAKEKFITLPIGKQIQLGILLVVSTIMFLVVSLLIANIFITINMIYKEIIYTLEIEESKQMDEILSYIELQLAITIDTSLYPGSWIHNYYKNLQDLDYIYELSNGEIYNDIINENFVILKYNNHEVINLYNNKLYLNKDSLYDNRYNKQIIYQLDDKEIDICELNKLLRLKNLIMLIYDIKLYNYNNEFIKLINVYLKESNLIVVYPLVYINSNFSFESYCTETLLNSISQVYNFYLNSNIENKNPDKYLIYNLEAKSSLNINPINISDKYLFDKSLLELVNFKNQYKDSSKYQYNMPDTYTILLGFNDEYRINIQKINNQNIEINNDIDLYNSIDNKDIIKLCNNISNLVSIKWSLRIIDAYTYNISNENTGSELILSDKVNSLYSKYSCCRFIMIFEFMNNLNTNNYYIIDSNNKENNNMNYVMKENNNIDINNIYKNNNSIIDNIINEKIEHPKLLQNCFLFPIGMQEFYDFFFSDYVSNDIIENKLNIDIIVRKRIVSLINEFSNNINTNIFLNTGNEKDAKIQLNSEYLTSNFKFNLIKNSKRFKHKIFKVRYPSISLDYLRLSSYELNKFNKNKLSNNIKTIDILSVNNLNVFLLKNQREIESDQATLSTLYNEVVFSIVFYIMIEWSIIYIVVLSRLKKINKEITEPIEKLTDTIINLNSDKLNSTNDNNSMKFMYEDLEYKEDSIINDMFKACKTLIRGGFNKYFGMNDKNILDNKPLLDNNFNINNLTKLSNNNNLLYYKQGDINTTIVKFNNYIIQEYYLNNKIKQDNLEIFNYNKLKKSKYLLNYKINDLMNENKITSLINKKKESFKTKDKNSEKTTTNISDFNMHSETSKFYSRKNSNNSTTTSNIIKNNSQNAYSNYYYSNMVYYNQDIHEIVYLFTLLSKSKKL